MRRWVLLACAVAACSFESSSSGSSGASVSTSEGSTSEVGSGTTGDGSSVGTTMGTMGPGGGTTEDPTGDPTLDPTEPTSSSGSTTSSSSSSGAESSSSSGGSSSPLSNAGLVARYFLDEAPAGSNPTLALDTADEPFDLPLEYVEGTMHYVSDLGRRGLAFDELGADDAARAPVAGSKFEGLDGITELTFEVVVRIADAMGQSSRVIHVGDGDASVVTLAARPNEIQVRWNTTVVRHWDYTAYMGTTHVVHLVIDTNAVNEDSQFRLLVDGAELDPIIDATVPQSEPAMVPNDAIIALGNRHQDRTFRGVLFYAAIYGAAIPDGTIADHVSVLMASDDTPE